MDPSKPSSSPPRASVRIHELKARWRLRVPALNHLTGVECLIYTGHVGISFNAESPIFGFNPDLGNEPGWAVINGLKQKNSKKKPYPGIVTDDTAIFYRAESDGLLYKKMEHINPKSKHEEILGKFKDARRITVLFYSSPGRGGDCN